MLVTGENFNRAESDRYFAPVIEEAGGIGKFVHNRELMPIDKQLRANCDTLDSGAVFDLDAAPVTITMPEARDRFMSLQLIDEDQHSWRCSTVQAITPFSKERIGTRYIWQEFGH